jgi:drug/metabolite transporter (DMT)-like permease
MVNSELSAVLFGLVSAASWGAGDFCGGIATKRSNAYSVVVVSQFVAFVILIFMTLLSAEAMPSFLDMVWGFVGGTSSAIGLVLFYKGLADGNMGIVSPLTAVISTFIPVVFGSFLEGLPAGSKLVGFGLALIAVWFLSRAGMGESFRGRDIFLPLVAGILFGLFFVIIDGVSERAVLWPLVSARVASVIVVSIVALVQRKSILPSKMQLPVIAVTGFFDLGGNVFFALAARSGRLDIASVVSSLYPGTTVLLALMILKERLRLWQWIGVGAALLAIALIAL